MSDIVLETRGLTKYFDNRVAVDHLDVTIPRGCICGFLGRNGSGKTTTIKMLLGLLHPTAGSAHVLGCDARALTPAIRSRIGYVTEGHRLFRWMTIQRSEQFQRAFFPGQWDSGFFREMLDYFQLSPRSKIKHLSNGQRAQVSLALTLAPHPELLIMDDPTLGLDAAIRRQFLEGMIGLIMHAGRTVLFSSHILGDVDRVCDRILVIDRGVLRANCTLEQFRQSIHKVRLGFNQAVPARLDIEGLLHYRQSDKELELVWVGQDKEIVTQWAAAHHARTCEFSALNLEDQFIEFTTTETSRQLFRWERSS